MIRYYCDGCNFHLETEQLNEAAAFAKKHGSQDLFCRICRGAAEEYWAEAAEVIAKAAHTYQATVANHRAGFFKGKAKKLKAVQ